MYKGLARKPFCGDRCHLQRNGIGLKIDGLWAIPWNLGIVVVVYFHHMGALG